MIKSIVVVDDSKVQCDHTVQLCQSIYPDIAIRWFYHGSEALDSLREQGCDLVLTDLEMPVMDGVQLAEFIAKERLASSVIICSSKDQILIESVGTMCESFGLHVSGVIAKPVSNSALQACFRKYLCLDNKRFMPSYTQELVEFSKSDLESGLAKSQFELFYQPKLTTGSLLLKGVEALARWKHPVHGYVPPVSFIQLAEQWGLIDELTFQLVEKGVDKLIALQGRGLKLSIAFNLSPKSIENKGFCERIDGIVVSKGGDPKTILFEVTENCLADNVATLISSLARLRLRGYGISIDDFGSQYSNYELLSKLPITELKIDRSMVDGVSGSWTQKNILESVVRMARKLNLYTVAEGLETCDDYLYLKSVGVDVIQGYYIAKPMAEEDLQPWISVELAPLRTTIKSLA